MFILNLIIAFSTFIVGYFVMTKSATIGLMTELLAGLFWVLGIWIIIAGAVDLYTNRKITGDPFLTGDD